MPKRKVKAKITRIVTETVTCILDSDGNVEEIDEVHDEHSSEVLNVVSIITEIHTIG
jgi:hypothetical protein